MRGATGSTGTLSSRLSRWFYGVALHIGAVWGTVSIFTAIGTWHRYLYPPSFQGYGPFLLNSPYFVAKDSARAVAALLLVAAAVSFWRLKDRLSAHLSLISVLVILSCSALDVAEAVRDSGENWLYMISVAPILDFVWSVAMTIAAFILLRLSPNNSFKPTPLRGAA